MEWVSRNDYTVFSRTGQQSQRCDLYLCALARKNSPSDMLVVVTTLSVHRVVWALTLNWKVATSDDMDRVAMPWNKNAHSDESNRW